ncbi:MAG TPA: hypothetical protein VEJ67_09660 [Candidatus Cybelea sp.]|nr:hypothetical protein [Candidatus Cybelea sp.]
MEILDRYLQTVKGALPAAQRDDIINELSEDIHSEIEERESELGRPLSEGELEVIVKRHGHPLIVASRYRQDQRSFSFGRQLIGPVLFPFYTKVLCFNLGITSVVILIIFTALLASGQSLSFHEAISTLFLQLVIQFAIVTPIFMACDRHLAKYPDRWDPRSPNPGHYPAVTVAAPTTVSRLESISQIIAVAVFLAWMRAVRGLPFLIFGPAAAFLKAAPVWRQLYLPVVLLALVHVAQSVINLFRPDWVWVRSLTRTAAGVVGLVICFFLLRAGVWVVPVGGNLSSGYQRAVAIVNKTLLYTLSAAFVIQALALLTELRRSGRDITHARASSKSR